MNVDFEGAEQCIDDHHVGIGYALNTDQELKQLVRFASLEGLVPGSGLYPESVSRVWWDHIRCGKIEKGQKRSIRSYRRPFRPFPQALGIQTDVFLIHL